MRELRLEGTTTGSEGLREGRLPLCRGPTETARRPKGTVALLPDAGMKSPTQEIVNKSAARDYR